MFSGFNWTFLNQCENFFEPIISLDKLAKSATELKPNGYIKVVIEVERGGVFHLILSLSINNSVYTIPPHL